MTRGGTLFAEVPAEATLKNLAAKASAEATARAILS